jgi:hypothetical protein
MMLLMILFAKNLQFSPSQPKTFSTQIPSGRSLTAFFFALTKLPFVAFESQEDSFVDKNTSQTSAEKRERKKFICVGMSLEFYVKLLHATTRREWKEKGGMRKEKQRAKGKGSLGGFVFRIKMNEFFFFSHSC